MAVKSPMEYFQEQDFSLASPQGGEQGEISPTERQFFRKYLGVEDPRELASLPKTEAQTVLQVKAPDRRQKKLRLRRLLLPVCPRLKNFACRTGRGCFNGAVP